MKYSIIINRRHFILALFAILFLMPLSSFAQKQDVPIVKKAVQINLSDTNNKSKRPPTRNSAIPELKVYQGGKLLHSQRPDSNRRKITVSQKPGKERPADEIKQNPVRSEMKIGSKRHHNPKRPDTTANKNNSKDDPPVFYEVYLTNGSDIDGDGYWDIWDFEIDIDPIFGTVAYDVWISIYDNYGNEWSHGPFDFSGYSSADNVVITDFDAALWGFTNESDVSFTFYADNALGGDSYFLDVAVDLPPDWPVFEAIYAVNTLDEDNNGYYELWDFEIDIDSYYGDIADNVYIEIWDDEGNSWGTFGPYDFSGYTSADNVFIEGFGSDYYNFNYAENVNFTFYAYNAYGDDQISRNTPVDKLWDYPTFYDVYIVNESDLDGDGWYDAWDFEMDVDALYNLTAEDVYIDIEDDEGNFFGTFGPYDFTGQTGDDNLVITDFSYNSYILNNPENVRFTFTAYNDYGSDQMNKDVPVDSYFEAPVFYETYADNISDADNDGYYEQWDLVLDIDAPYNGVAENVYIEITDNEGNNWGTYGPYTFEGETSADNVSISSWYMEDYNFQAPADVVFSFYAYNNKGNDTEYLTAPVDVISTDAGLSSLKVNSTAVPGFEPETLTYNYDLPYSTNTIPTVTASPNHPAAKVQITQATNLSGTQAQRTATTDVTAQDGSTTLSYEIVFNLLPPNDDATLSNLSVEGLTVDGFASNTYSYTYYVAFSETQVPITTATANDPYAEVQISHAANLEGTQEERTSTVTVTAENGTTTLSYKIIFNKLPISDDATLKDLTVNGETVAGFHPTVINYSVDLPHESSIPVVIGAPNHKFAQVIVQNAENLEGSEEERTTTVEVTAEDDETIRVYSILFNLLPVSTEETDKWDISVYPNPAHNFLNIETKGITHNYDSRIRILNAAGKIMDVRTHIFRNKIQIPVNNWADGMYILIIDSQNKTFTKRFMIVK